MTSAQSWVAAKPDPTGSTESMKFVRYSVPVTEVVTNPEQGGAPEHAFVVPNNSAFHLLIRNKGPGDVTVHQDGAFITPVPKGATLLRTFRTPGRLSVLSAGRATAEITVLGVDAD
jgi:hypothetical protein